MWELNRPYLSRQMCYDINAIACPEKQLEVQLEDYQLIKETLAGQALASKR